MNLKAEMATILQNISDKEMLSKKNVLVTGCSGFLGSWICDVLTNLGSNVTGLDDLSTGLKTNIEHLFAFPNFHFICKDVKDFQNSREKFDYIFHLASRASPQEYILHPIATLQSNSIGLSKLLELCRLNGSKLVYFSTSEIYGDTNIFPTPETDWGHVNPVGPRSCYDEGKRFGEALCVAYSKEYGLDTRIVRIFNTYGPKIRSDGLYGRVIPRFIMQSLNNLPVTVFGNGSQTRSFCYVTDTITGIMNFVLNEKARNEIINIGNGEEISILNLAKKIISILNSNSRIEFKDLPEDDPCRRVPDILKAQKLLGWSPVISLEEGLKKTILWFKERGK